MVLTSEKNIIATSSAELFSAVLYRALACSGMLWRALTCSGMQNISFLQDVVIDVQYTILS
jgi:hypothetical protein